VRFELAEKERKLLREIQRNEKYKRDYIKVTVLLMLDLGETPQKVALFLGTDDSTIYRHWENYQTQGLDKYLENSYLGYWGKLSSHEIGRLRKELKTRLYENAQEICQFIKEEFGVEYRAEGLVPLLHRIGFEYKKTKQVPCKADEAAQAEFIAKFAELQLNKEEGEVHYFIDAVHPTLNSEASYGWIEKGAEYQIQSNSGRTRANILGALNPNEVTDIITTEYKTINSEWAVDFIEEIGRRNPEAKKIRLFSDNAGYFKKVEKDGLITDERIEIVWLPTYSPNLNLIERLWKLMKKETLKNKYYGTAKGFREKIREFFENIKEYKTELETLLTCNFRVVSFSQTNS
jgi:transposase